ncbi:MAG TPA: enoyl-CoA hydratase/isomerase family protein [Myxococcaceae bacterium]|nr:enoyl-CoA hydratase/isomerase family protein [Myxococcaceae bacterium]
MADLISERRDDVMIVTLNRPEKRNALSNEMLALLSDALEQAAEDGSLRALILSGAGDKSFSAGIDLGLLFEHLSSNPSGEKIRRLQRKLQELICRLEELEKPTIAAIEGSCVGGGLEVALGCDLRVASSEAKFGFPEAKIGMLPDLGGTSRLPRLVGPAIAKEWIFSGRMYPAQRALELGLVNQLASPGQALQGALALAQELSACGPIAIAWAKRVIDRGLSMPLRDSLELEQDAMTEILPGDDLKEGVLSFLEKRPAKFRGNRPK